jgi:hypothetical protein
MALSVRGGPCSLCHSPWRLGGNVEAVVSSADDGLARGVEVVCAEFGALAQAGAGLCPACRRGPTTGDGNHDKREVTPRPRGKPAMRGLPRGAQQVADVIPGGAAQPQGGDPEAQHLDGPPGGRPVLDGGLQRGQIRLPSAENDAELASQLVDEHLAALIQPLSAALTGAGDLGVTMRVHMSTIHVDIPGQASKTVNSKG